jgi:uncharacterized protein YqhQ
MKRKTEDCSFRTSIGGQALIEGILMRGPKKQAVVCRTKDGLVEKVEELKLVRDRHPVLGLPFIRGIVTLFDSLYKGMQALTYSASLVPLEEQGEPDKLDQWIEAHFEGEKAQKLIISSAVVMGVGLSLFLFIFLPAFLVGLIPALKTHFFARNLSEGAVRIAILLLYMRLICEMSDVKRLFSYHGAEHKTIFCYEHGKELTVENVRKQIRFHPRCCTSFMVIMLILGIVVGLFVPTWLGFWRPVIKIALIPVTCGIGYELIKLCGRHDNRFTRIIAAPGLWAQRITTKEPDDDMIEVAIEAIKAVIPEDGSDIIKCGC